MNRDDLSTIDLALPSGLAMEYARAATTTTSTRKSAPRAALEAVAAPRQPCCPASARESFSAPSNYMGLRTALHADRDRPCGPQHENKWAESPSGMPSPGSRLPCSSVLFVLANHFRLCKGVWHGLQPVEAFRRSSAHTVTTTRPRRTGCSASS